MINHPNREMSLQSKGIIRRSEEFFLKEGGRERRARERLDEDSIMAPDGVGGKQTGSDLSEEVVAPEKIRRTDTEESWADAEGCHQIVDEVCSVGQVPYWQAVDIQVCISTCAQRLYLTVDRLKTALGEWNLPLIRQNFFPVNVIAVLSLPSGLTTIVDSLLWHHSKEGEYMVKSGYFVATSSGSARSCSSAVSSRP
ncbi:hypothetical protein ACOSP7_014925 [Xanthoceras sorbifolium]